jgi:hypothetical protein
MEWRPCPIRYYFTKILINNIVKAVIVYVDIGGIFNQTAN